MVSPEGPVSLWKRADAFDHSLSLGASLTRVIADMFSKYDRLVEDETMSVVNEGSPRLNAISPGSADSEYDSESDRDIHDVSMSSEYSFFDGVQENSSLKVIHFENSDSDESMSIAHWDQDDDRDHYHQHVEDDYNYSDDDGNDTPRADRIRLASWKATRWPTGGSEDVRWTPALAVKNPLPDKHRVDDVQEDPGIRLLSPCGTAVARGPAPLLRTPRSRTLHLKLWRDVHLAVQMLNLETDTDMGACKDIKAMYSRTVTRKLSLYSHGNRRRPVWRQRERVDGSSYHVINQHYQGLWGSRFDWHTATGTWTGDTRFWDGATKFLHPRSRVPQLLPQAH
ncbi:hypothetical protein DPEC_G00068950 [Dallia pectoralis]|uniref:Uncharacterized protein n=1 Tax=Dallia pectoralis TaxID=75939 RepID=A0ACC2H1H8_DALPE|nr:hypothetical protein DPEC_G00068950 [Dallia pectoralis]